MDQEDYDRLLKLVAEGLRGKVDELAREIEANAAMAAVWKAGEGMWW
jgi:hypothetical protein